MRDLNEPEQMPKSGLFGIRLVKRIPSIVNVFFFEIPTLNGLHSAVQRTFGNAVLNSSTTHPHQYF